MSKLFMFTLFVVCLDSVRSYLEFEVPRNAFDTDLYDAVLDEELCEDQLSYLLNNATLLKAQFLDAGIRIPRSILQGNFVDLGNYHQCLAISHNFEPSDIEGKYCMINIPIMQDLDLPECSNEWSEVPWLELLPNTRQHRNLMKNIEKVQKETGQYSRLAGPNTDLMRVTEGSALADAVFKLAVCLPKACTTRQFIDTVLINTTAVGLRVTEKFCRLRNDKPFVPGDYAAMGVFGVVILITILSTSYDLYDTFIVKEPKRASTIGKTFSIYTNTHRLLTFKSTPGALECLDGIRSLAITWVIVGHTYSTQSTTHFYNPMEMFSWRSSLSAVWILAASFSVDTFFLLSGLLLVYTSVGKINQMGLIKNVHLFYLRRLLRMFPVLAAGVFLQATLVNHISDGPEWYVVGDQVERCKTYWWSTLTYLQNYLINNSGCISPTWYLAVDMQMHILSPILLYWVLGKRKSAWVALTLAMLSIMVVTTTYNYLNAFPPAPAVPTRSAEETLRYTKYYYVNTLTRCSPFFVGMMFGYLLNVNKGKKVHLPRWFVSLAWMCAFVVLAGIIYSVYPILQMDWNSPFWDGVINSFARPGWAICLGWITFACTHGYGGPISWFLSLRMWKLPARLSFAMYIFHYPIIQIVNAASVEPTHFTAMRYFYRFLADLVATLVVSLMVAVVIDSPFSTLITLAIGGGKSKEGVTREDKRGTTGNNDGNDSKKNLEIKFAKSISNRESAYRHVAASSDTLSKPNFNKDF